MVTEISKLKLSAFFNEKAEELLSRFGDNYGIIVSSFP